MSVLHERRAIEKTYSDICSVYVMKESTVKHITKQRRTLAYEKVKCALSQKNLRGTDQTESQNKIEYDAKLFMAPDFLIAAGSEIEVSRQGRLYSFRSAGEPFVYDTHQEIILKRKDRA